MIFGVGEEIDRLGAKVAGICDQAATHVPVEIARAARDDARRLNADCAVAIGGGSTIGPGKALALERVAIRQLLQDAFEGRPPQQG